MTKGVQMRAAGDGAVLTLMGDVGFEITARGVADALKAAGKGPLTVSLHSYGGDALAGVAIHNMLARHPAQKTVVVEGVAASAASLIAMAGDRIVMPSNALMMIHEAWGLAMGDSDDMRKQADVLDHVSGAYRRTYAARSGRTEDEVAALMAAETWWRRGSQPRPPRRSKCVPWPSRMAVSPGRRRHSPPSSTTRRPSRSTRRRSA
jgi:ATP-dependent Clp protease, protease subunit